MRVYRITTPAGSRVYHLHLPRGVRRTAQVPLVVALHGCDQSARAFAVGTRLNDLADRNGFAVVYPEQSVLANGQRCWSWFRPEHQQRYLGEPAIIAGIVRRLTAEQLRWRIDPERVYVTGISAGGGMAMVLAATYPDVFAAVGVHSGPPYRAASRSGRALAAMQGHTLPPPPPAADDQPMPPLVVFHGTADFTVRRANVHRLVDQWIAWSDGGPPLGQARSRYQPPSGTRAGARGHSVSFWTAGRRRLLEVWEVEGLGHAWSGGAADHPYSDPRGPRASTQMWRFFSRHVRVGQTLAGQTLAGQTRAGRARAGRIQV